MSKRTYTIEGQTTISASGPEGGGFVRVEADDQPEFDFNIFDSEYIPGIGVVVSVTLNWEDE